MRIRSRLVATAVAGALFSVSTVATVSPARAIHRGHDARISSYPFMVSLRLAATPGSPRCGGTLIEADIVLTAAHCVAAVQQGGIVAVVGADIPDWRRAPRVDTLAHAIPETFDLSVDNRDDIAVLRLATPQSTPTVELATAEPGVRDHVVTAGWGCTNAPPVCEVMATSLQSSRQAVLDEVASCGTDVFWTRPLYFAPTTICTEGVKVQVDDQPWGLGWPAARRWPVWCWLPAGRSHLAGLGQQDQALRRVHFDPGGGRLAWRGDRIIAELLNESDVREVGGPEVVERSLRLDQASGRVVVALSWHTTDCLLRPAAARHAAVCALMNATMRSVRPGSELNSATPWLPPG